MCFKSFVFIFLIFDNKHEYLRFWTIANLFAKKFAFRFTSSDGESGGNSTIWGNHYFQFLFLLIFIPVGTYFNFELN